MNNPISPVLRLKLDLHKQAANNFVDSKGRMPSDKYELQSWLMEFTEELGQLLSHWQEAVMEDARLKVTQDLIRNG